MQGKAESLTIGERIAWYRRRRGMSQDVLAGLVGRSSNWLGKIENNRIELDRLSVLRRLAHVLGVELSDLIDEPTQPNRTAHDATSRMVPSLRAALVDYQQLTPLLSASAPNAEAPSLAELERSLRSVFDAYQDSRFEIAAGRAPSLLADALLATRQYEGDKLLRANEILALSYQATASILTKIGEANLAWMAAERGLTAAEETVNHAVIGSLFRSVSFALLCTGRLNPAVRLAESGFNFLRPHLRGADRNLLSVYGTLLLATSMATSRLEDRPTTRLLLNEAADVARRVDTDSNHLWTAFGPTNVAIHRVSTAMELGDVQIALNIGPTLDTSPLPAERRARHLLDVARAYNLSGRGDDALHTVLYAERLAPEQVHHHHLSRGLVMSWIRDTHGRPSIELDRLGRRMRIIGQAT